jgi:methylenetetrahydrofolate dehydrogenase (NADP+)/methenyltetrahydrofolate cyclohydrolase
MVTEKLLSGNPVAQAVNEDVSNKASYLKSRGILPKLTVILVGNDPASKIYVGRKEKSCLKLGMDSKTIYLDEKTSEAELLTLIGTLNNDPLNHGILVQLPLPKQINEQKVLLSIDPMKDVDCFHPLNVGLLVSGRPYVLPCTPAGIMQILKSYEISSAGKHAVVMGRSNIVGKPMANLLLQKNREANATVTVVHSRTEDIALYTQAADLLIAAMGSANFVKAEMIKPGCIIIDVGMNRIPADNERGYELVGDVDFGDVSEKCGRITPVPGGVGPMTIAMLMKNTITAAASQHEINLE